MLDTWEISEAPPEEAVVCSTLSGTDALSSGISGSEAMLTEDRTELSCSDAAGADELSYVWVSAVCFVVYSGAVIKL